MMPDTRAGCFMKGIFAMALGIIALVLGLGSAGAGAYVGFTANRMLVPMPGGLPAMAQETVAIGMFVVGALTMLLGVVTIYRSNEG
jgi:hypothetical protein